MSEDDLKQIKEFDEAMKIKGKKVYYNGKLIRGGKNEKR